MGAAAAGSVVVPRCGRVRVRESSKKRQIDHRLYTKIDTKYILAWKKYKLIENQDKISKPVKQVKLNRMNMNIPT